MFIMRVTFSTKPLILNQKLLDRNSSYLWPSKVEWPWHKTMGRWLTITSGMARQKIQPIRGQHWVWLTNQKASWCHHHITCQRSHCFISSPAIACHFQMAIIRVRIWNISLSQLISDTFQLNRYLQISNNFQRVMKKVLMRRGGWIKSTFVRGMMLSHSWIGD